MVALSAARDWVRLRNSAQQMFVRCTMFWLSISRLKVKATKSNKTDGSQRVVPVHSTLIELGFIRYVEANASAGAQQQLIAAGHFTIDFVSR